MHLQLHLLNMHHSVQRGALTPLGYYGDLRERRPTHEQDDVGVPGLAQHRHFVLEGLQLCLSRVGDLQLLYGDWPCRG